MLLAKLVMVLCSCCLALWSSLAVVSAEQPIIQYKPYSTSGTEIDGKLIRLNTYSSKTYTHYLGKTSELTNYAFSVETSSRYDGMFVTFNEFKLLPRVGDLFRFHGELSIPICTKYNIEFKYADGAVHWLCDVANRNYTDYFDHRYIMEDFKGFGTINVTISSLDKNMAPEISYTGLKSTSTMVGPKYREIPRDTIGTITFTLYKNCEFQTIPNKTNATAWRDRRANYRSCSPHDQTKCIWSDLFCDGDINCVTSILDVFLSSPRDLDDTSGYDESSKRCADKNLVWKPKPSLRNSDTNNQGYGYPNSVEYSGGGGGGGSSSGSSFKPTRSSLKTLIFIGLGVVGAIVSVSGWLMHKKRNAAAASRRNNVEAQYVPVALVGPRS